jgi:hypothetical protein
MRAQRSNLLRFAGYYFLKKRGIINSRKGIH